MGLSTRVLHIVVLAAALPSCSEHPDALCRDRSEPIGTEVVVGVFDSDGNQICVDPMRMVATDLETGLATDVFRPAGGADLNGDGKMIMGLGCNVFRAAAPLGGVWSACDGSIHVALVMPDGCAADTVWTWADNTYEERGDLSWYVPVIVDCASP